MTITIRSTNHIPRLRRVLRELGRTEIQVGVFGHDSNVDEGDANIVTIARVHEYGMVITPKHSKYLTIPVIPEAKNKRASDFGDTLFFHKTDNGGILARDKGNGQIETVFVLVKSVTIPERSFLRTGFDKNVSRITTKIENLLSSVFQFGINPDIFAEMIGREFAGLIQKELKDLRSPANAPATVAVKGSNNPLMDTGRLVGAIDYKVK